MRYALTTRLQLIRELDGKIEILMPNGWARLYATWEDAASHPLDTLIVEFGLSELQNRLKDTIHALEKGYDQACQEAELRDDGYGEAKAGAYAERRLALASVLDGIKDYANPVPESERPGTYDVSAFCEALGLRTDSRP